MLEFMEKASSAGTRDAVGASMALAALVYFTLRTPGKRCPSLLTLSVGLLFLFMSYAIGYLGGMFDRPSAGFLSPSHPAHQAVQIALRNYIALPLLILGALLETTRIRRRLNASEGSLHEQERRARDLARTVEDVVSLEDSLEEKSRDLQATREELHRESTEASRVSTKLRETLNLLMASEEKFRSIIERANDGFVIVDLETRTISQANPRMAELTGYEVSELAGMTLRSIYGPEIGEGHVTWLRELSSKGRLPPVDILRKDGKKLPAEISISIIDIGGRPVLVAIARDVTERIKLLEAVEEQNRILEEREKNLREANLKLALRAEKVRAMNEKLRELQEVKDSFLSSVSHELRTPLTSIRSFSEILLQYRDADDDLKLEFISIINKESERLTRLINDVLDLAKIEAGEMNFVMSVVDLRDLVHEVSQSLSPLASQRGLRIESELPEDLPAVTGDQDKLHQVLTNLLSNAVKFGREGTPVEIAARIVEEGLVEVAVRDYGPGIHKEQLTRIFDKFSQVGDTLSEKPEGTGLGLAICREIITLHGGKIWVQSSLGEGSTFYFTVKVYAAEPGPQAPETEAPAPADESVPVPELAPAAKEAKLPPLPRREDMRASSLRPLVEPTRPPSLD